MAGIDIMGGLNKAFLATVGAVAINAEKSQQAAKEAASETTDGALRTFLEALSDEDRAAYAEKVAQMTADIAASKVEVDVEDGDEPAGDADDEAPEADAE